MKMEIFGIRDNTSGIWKNNKGREARSKYVAKKQAMALTISSCLTKTYNLLGVLSETDAWAHANILRKSGHSTLDLIRSQNCINQIVLLHVKGKGKKTYSKQSKT
ncbi:hypothetical protein RIF29_11982 [Crotalaria pallida]|uniref:Uncharacterized protein n=1 Tax=Crotalaria pallida TaxID=3830 RepID=A0AAN9IMR5_CROPI